MGIIGGADGPTAIFVASSGNRLKVGLLGVVVVGVTLFFILRNRKKS